MSILTPGAVSRPVILPTSRISSLRWSAVVQLITAVILRPCNLTAKQNLALLVCIKKLYKKHSKTLYTHKHYCVCVIYYSTTQAQKQAFYTKTLLYFYNTMLVCAYQLIVAKIQQK
jgi:hypothetical protein